MLPEGSAAEGAGGRDREQQAYRGLPHVFGSTASARLLHGAGGFKAARPQVFVNYPIPVSCTAYIQ